MRGRKSTWVIRHLSLLAIAGVCAALAAAGAALAGTATGAAHTSTGATVTAPGGTALASSRTPATVRHSTALLKAGCQKTSAGRLVHCAKPVPAALQPAGTRNTSTVTTAPSPSSLASLVDTRTCGRRGDVDAHLGGEPGVSAIG